MGKNILLVLAVSHLIATSIACASTNCTSTDLDFEKNPIVTEGVGQGHDLKNWADKIAPENPAPSKNKSSLLPHYNFGPNRPQLREVTPTSVLVDWKEIYDDLDKRLAKDFPGRKFKLAAVLYHNGDPIVRTVKGEKTEFIDRSQTSMRVVIKPGMQEDFFVHIVDLNTEKEVHQTDLGMIESMGFIQQVSVNVHKKIIEKKLFDIGPVSFLTQIGIHPDLTKTAVVLGYTKLVWILAKDAEYPVRKLINDLGSRAGVRMETDNNDEVTSYTIFDRDNPERVLRRNVDPKNFIVKVDAAFNGNSFFWDDMLVALATVPLDPKTARDTVNWWLSIQEPDGMIAREPRKINGKSLWSRKVVRYGSEARENLQYTNPYLINWVADTLYAFSPSAENFELLKRVSVSMEKFASAFEKYRAVRDAQGNIIGFTANALETGADDNSGGRGNDFAPDSYKAVWISKTTQQIGLYKSIARYNKMFLDEAKAKGDLTKAREYDEKIKMAEGKIDYFEGRLQQHWDPKTHFFYDLIFDKASGSWVRDTRYATIQGFLPLFSQSATPEQVSALIKEWLTPERFGGGFPLPANARDHVKDYHFADEKSFDEEDGYWAKWAHWPSLATIVMEGFKRMGRPDVAFKLSAGFLKGMSDHFKQFEKENGRGTVLEVYGEVKTPGGVIMGRKAQHGHHQTRVDFAGWGKLPPIYSMLMHIVGLDPQFDGHMDWNIMVPLKAGENMSVSNLKYQDKLVKELELKKTGEDEYELTVVSEAPFKLKLNSLLTGHEKLSKDVQAASGLMIVGGGLEPRTYKIKLQNAMPAAG